MTVLSFPRGFQLKALEDADEDFAQLEEGERGPQAAAVATAERHPGVRIGAVR